MSWLTAIAGDDPAGPNGEPVGRSSQRGRTLSFRRLRHPRSRPLRVSGRPGMPPPPPM